MSDLLQTCPRPSCAELNRPQALFCWRCGARLALDLEPIETAPGDSVQDALAFPPLPVRFFLLPQDEEL